MEDAMAAVTSSWWSAHEPKKWSGTGIGERLRAYEGHNRKLLEAGAGDRPKNDDQKRLGRQSRQALEDILERLSTWKRKHPLSGTEAQEVDSFERQVRIARDQLKWYG
jgi:hypothetical protein